MSDPAQTRLLFQNGCHCHYTYHLPQNIVKSGQFRALWSQLVGVSVMLRHLLCIFSHSAYEHFCISDTYNAHLITSDLPEGQLTHKVVWLVPVRAGSGEIKLSGFSFRKTS